MTTDALATRRLELGDIADLRAYERERPEFQQRVYALKRRRRVAVGPLVTMLFENRDTVRFQIQEMARAEKLITDEEIQTELDIYNPLIPEPGTLSATLFLELTSRTELEEWLPKLVGVERAAQLVIGDGDRAVVVRAQPEEAHEQQLTREDVTASVHYVHFRLTPAHVDGFAAGPVAVAIAHPAYEHSTTLGDDVRAELLTDLRGEDGA